MADISANIETGFYPQAGQNALLGAATQGAQLRNTMAQNALIKVDTQQNQQNLLANRLQFLAGQFSTLANKPDLSPQDFQTMGQQMVKEGFDPNMYNTEMQSVAAANGDPAKLQALAQSYSKRALDGVAQFQSVYGVPSTQDSGSSNLAGNTNPFTGAFTPSSAGAKALTPEAGATQTTIPSYDSNGQPTGGGTVTTLANAVKAENSGPPSGAGGVPGLQQITPQQMDLNKQGTAQWSAAKQADASFSSDIVPLQKIISLLPQTMTGPGSETVSNLAKVAQTFGINLPGSATQADYYDQLRKYTTRLAALSGAAPNSDAQLAASFSGNPNVDMNNAAAQDVAKTVLTLSRMQHAGVALGEQQGMDAQSQNWPTWRSQWGAQQDPRAYGVDLMDPAAKAALRKELDANPAAAAKFAASYTAAKQAGVLGGLPGG